MISARKSLRISAKTFFFYLFIYFFGDHLFLGGKFVISARKSLRISAKTFFLFIYLFFWRSPVFGRKICDIGQKKPSDFGENLCPPHLNFAPPPISRSWRRPCLTTWLKFHKCLIKLSTFFIRTTNQCILG